MRVAVVAGPDPGHAFPAIALCLRFLAAGDLPVLLTGRQWLDTARDAGVDARELLGSVQGRPHGDDRREGMPCFRGHVAPGAGRALGVGVHEEHPGFARDELRGEGDGHGALARSALLSGQCEDHARTSRRPDLQVSRTNSAPQS